MFRAVVAVLLSSACAEVVEFDPVDPRIVYSGRFVMQPGNVSFVWSGSTISTRFTGTSIGANMRDPHGQYDVIIDGQKSFQPFNPRASTPTDCLLASQLLDGTHTLVLRRRTEGFSNQFGEGTASIFSFYVDEGRDLLEPIKPAGRKPIRRIEVIGDSIMCGSGVLGLSSDCDFSFDTEDFFSTYAFLAAQRLKAQIHAICWSGKGLIKNFNDSCQVCPNAMPAYFPYTLDILNDESSKWNFSAYEPDAVIISLGVNDFDPKNPGPVVAEADFIAAYKVLINNVKTNYSDNVQVFVTCRKAPNLDGNCDVVQKVVSEMNDPHVHYVDLTWDAEPAESLGCGFHPGLSGHAYMADLLVASMGPITGWAVNVPPVRIEAVSIVLLVAFFLIGIGGHIWGCVVRKPSKDKALLLEQTR